MDQRTAYARLHELVSRPGALMLNGHRVTKVERWAITVKQHCVRAYTEEGDMCDGQPVAVLRKLTRHLRDIKPWPEEKVLYLPDGSVQIFAETAEVKAQ